MGFECVQGGVYSSYPAGIDVFRQGDAGGGWTCVPERKVSAIRKSRAPRIATWWSCTIVFSRIRTCFEREKIYNIIYYTHVCTRVLTHIHTHIYNIKRHFKRQKSIRLYSIYFSSQEVYKKSCLYSVYSVKRFLWWSKSIHVKNTNCGILSYFKIIKKTVSLSFTLPIVFKFNKKCSPIFYNYLTFFYSIIFHACLSNPLLAKI